MRAIIEIEHDGPAPDFGAVQEPLAQAITDALPFDLEIRTLSGTTTFVPGKVTIEEGDA